MFLPFIYFGFFCLVNSFFTNKPKLNNRSLNMLIKNNEYSYAIEYQEFYNNLTYNLLIMIIKNIILKR